MPDLHELEFMNARISGFVLRAARVADRSEFLPCTDPWATADRLSRLDDAVFAGQRALRALCA